MFLVLNNSRCANMINAILFQIIFSYSVRWKWDASETPRYTSNGHRNFKLFDAHHWSIKIYYNAIKANYDDVSLLVLLCELFNKKNTVPLDVWLQTLWFCFDNNRFESPRIFFFPHWFFSAFAICGGRQIHFGRENSLDFFHWAKKKDRINQKRNLFSLAFNMMNEFFGIFLSEFKTSTWIHISTYAFAAKFSSFSFNRIRINRKPSVCWFFFFIRMRCFSYIQCRWNDWK